MAKLKSAWMLYMVKNVFNEFHTSDIDEPRPGAPKTVIAKDNVTKLHDFALADSRSKVREIAEAVDISKNRVGHILL